MTAERYESAFRPPNHPTTPSPNHPLCDCHLLLFLLDPTRGHQWQSQQGERMVVGSDPIAAFDAAPVAAMDHHLLPIRAIGDAHRGHHRPARALPIPRLTAVDMARRQAEWTVVAMPSTGNRWPNECPAVAALERLGLVGPNSRPRPAMLHLVLVRPVLAGTMTRRD